MALGRCRCWTVPVSGRGTLRLPMQSRQERTLRRGSLAWCQQQSCKSQPPVASLAAARQISRRVEPACCWIPCPIFYERCAEERQRLRYLCRWLRCHCGSVISAWLWAFQRALCHCPAPAAAAPLHLQDPGLALQTPGAGGTQDSRQSW